MRRVRWLVGGAALIALAVGMLWLHGGGPRWVVRLQPHDLGTVWRLADQGCAALALLGPFVEGPDGRSYYGPVEVRDPATGRLVRTIWRDGPTFAPLEASTHGPWVAGIVEEEGKAALHWANIHTGEIKSLPLTGDAGRDILFSPQGDLAFVAFRLEGVGEQLLAVHLPTGEQAAWLPRRHSRPANERFHSIGFVPEERFGGRWLFLLESNSPARVVLWDCLTRERAGGFPVVREAYSEDREKIEVTPDGRTLTASRGSDDPVQLWRLDDPAGPVITRTRPAGWGADPKAWTRERSPCGRWVAGLPVLGSPLRIVDNVTNDIRELPLPLGPGLSMRFSDSGRLWVWGSLEREARTWWDWLPSFLRGSRPTHRISSIDPESGRIEFQLDRPTHVTDALPLPDGTGVLTVEGVANAEATLLCRYDAVQPPVWPSVLALLLCLTGAPMLAIGAWPRRKAA